MMDWWPLSPATIGLVSIGFTVVVAFLQGAISRALKTHEIKAKEESDERVRRAKVDSDVALAGLSSVLAGYKTLIDKNNEEIDRQARVIRDLRDEVRRLEAECAKQLGEVEARLAAAEQRLREYMNEY